ncbi:amidohydrolase family protein [Flavihumibacter sp. R14]|nr:amidohydrolase family protein [Flavihumibacter soli]
MRIDAHQHFWKYNPVRDSWINSEMGVLRRDFLPGDLEPLLHENKIDACVAIQADQSEDESHFLLDLASQNDFIKGVVGWVDLSAGNIEERLAYWSTYDKLKGFRHIIQAELEDDFILNKDFCRGISRLGRFGFTYDILVFPKHLPFVLKFLSQFPDQPFVIDHIAKPNIREGGIIQWREQLRQVALFPNVYCKLSGMVTEADLHNWATEDFKPYIDAAIESFGIDRVMFGSDWPVCLLGAGYDQCRGILEENTRDLSMSEKDKLWGGNAMKFYRLAV